MLEKTKLHVRTALRYSKRLLNAEAHDASNTEASSVPKNIGVYLWRSKRNNEIVYIGRALGKAGLRQRIMHQHLANGYTKSVFRRQIAMEKGLNLREQSVSFIKKNFNLSFISLEGEDAHTVLLVETLLIYECCPRYNRAGNIGP